MSSKSVRTVEQALRSYASADKARRYARFFKTGKGQYGEGDRFIGVTVPEVREVAKEYRKSVTLEIIDELLASPIHEVRLCALILLMSLYKRADPKMKKTIFDFYLAHTKMINNWDLVDLTAPYIVGNYLLNEHPPKTPPHKIPSLIKEGKQGRSSPVHISDHSPLAIRHLPILIKLAKSASLWERRIAILATFAFIRAGRHQEAFAIAELLLHDDHDLIHKAIGWMLREVGKRIGKDTLREFLDKHAGTMPRTALRYAIEHMEKEERVKYLHVPHFSRTQKAY